MKLRKMPSWVAVSVGMLFSSMAWAGAIEGSVQGVKDPSQTVVYLKEASGDFSPPAKHPVLTQKNKTYIPHVLAILKGTTVEIRNEDDFLHNVHSLGPTNFNIAMPKFRKQMDQVFDKSGLHPIVCDVHAEMSAFVLVLQNPYFTVPNKDGSFQIPNVPAGNYTLEVWDEQKKTKSAPVQVGSGATKTNLAF